MPGQPSLHTASGPIRDTSPQHWLGAQLRTQRPDPQETLHFSTGSAPSCYNHVLRNPLSSRDTLNRQPARLCGIVGGRWVSAVHISACCVYNMSSKLDCVALAVELPGRFL